MDSECTLKIWSTVEPKGKTAFLTAGNRRDGAATSQKSVVISENRKTTKTRHGSRKQEEAVEENQPLPAAGAPNPR